MSNIVLTLPIVSGKTEAWRRFCQELSGARLRTYIASRRRLGITHERVELVETPFGSASVNTFEAVDLSQAFAQIATSELTFDVWYRERLQELHGITLSSYELYAQPGFASQGQELVFEWKLTPNARDEPRRPPQGIPK